MAEVASAFVSLLPSARGFGTKLNGELGPDLDKAGVEGGKRYGTGMASGLKSVAGLLGGVFAAVKVVDFFKDSVAEARESQKVGALTAQVIKSTGGAAKVTAAQVGDLATAISNQTGIDDEAVQAGANLLLTFKNIRNEAGKGNDIFNQTTSIMTDMATAMGQEPKAAAIQLGKALNDPVKGITALTRVGVTFSDSQKEAIKKMVESGNVMGAQKIILKELQSEFGGAAAAASTDGEKFSTAFANFKEAIGTALLPVLDGVLGAATRLTTFLTGNVGPAFSVLGPTVKGAASALAGLVTFFALMSKHTTTVKVIAGIIGTLLIPKLITLGVQATISAAMQVGAWVATQAATIAGAAVSVISSYRVVAGWVASAAAAVASGAETVAIWALYKLEAIQGAAVFMLNVAKIVAGWVLMGAQSLLAAAKVAASWLIAMGPIGLVIAAVVGLVVIIVKNWDTIKGATAAAWNAVKSAISTAVSAVIGFVKAHWGLIVSIITGPLGALVVLIIKHWSQIKSAVSTGVSNAVTAVKELPGKIKGALSGAGKWLVSAGKNIVQGLIDGIKSLAGDVVSALLDLLPGPLKKFAGKLGIHSPSTVFEAFGENTVKGFVLGVRGSQGSVDSVMGDMSSRVALPALSVPRVPALRAGSLDSASAADRASAVSLVRLHPDDLRTLARLMVDGTAGVMVGQGGRLQGMAGNRPAS